jgi:copper chaperone CopZ
MKKIVGLLLVALLLNTTITAQFNKAQLQASGLTCALCTKAIDNALKKISFVESVAPNIKTSSFTIVFKKDAAVDADALRVAVEDAGFFISKLQLTGFFSNIPVKNDTHVTVDGKTFHFINAKEQVLNGEQTITLVDKLFVPARQFKKMSTATTHTCLQTGKAAACCEKVGADKNARIYHVTI